MIRKEKTDNYILLEVGAYPLNDSLLNLLEKEIKAAAPDILVDLSKATVTLSDDLVNELNRLGKLGNLVWIAGEEHYELYNEQESLTINVVPTVPEAADMLFMVKMENELGGEDFEI
ncbi:hypothetical protein [Luteibaculum oceani]|uniref:STAS domain-containing protein n=1 Tax=Luteibaculum oceani TaxID=1294296 RepID=A0A5C6V114_9FLAO|nr:hypothetical protein [Luteibaculum oceani]TXC76958.1 hypothetical protein FRX97_10105 [Luteibaculum oceani]